MGLSAPAGSSIPALSGIGAPSAAAPNGSRYTELDSVGNAVGEWLRTGGAWSLLYDTEDVVITSAEYPTRPPAGDVLDRTVYINLSTKAISVTSGGTWIESVGGGGGGAPSGAAGGDLTGTYPNPTIASSVALTGNPTAPTQTAGNNSTRIATTAFVAAAVTGGGGGSLTDGAVLQRHLSDEVRLGAFAPTGTVVTNILDRFVIGSQTTTPTVGTLRVSTNYCAIVPAGKTITNLNVMSVNAGTGPFTNSWMCILDASRVVLATTQDLGAATFSTNTTKTYRIASTIGGSTAGSWTPSSTTPIYVGLLVAGGTTSPQFYGATLSSVTANISPPITGNSTTGLTDPASLPSTAGAISGGGSGFWWWAT